MTFSITHATRYVLLAAALATLGGCATPQQQAQMQAWQQIQAQQQALAQESGKIGAVLASDAQGRVVIGTLVPGAPSDQSGEVHTGDQLLAVAEGDGEPQSVGGKSMLEVRLMVQGEPNTPVSLVLAGQDGGDDRTVTLTRAEITPQQQQALAEIQQAEAQARVEGLAIEDNSGEYLSPYTSDGVTAEWVNKAINAKMGSAAGSAVGAAAGAYAGRKALESVPGGSLIGSFFGGMAGSKAGQNVGRDAAIQASGGWEYIRETSDLSFRSLNDMARWMTTVHGQKSNFQEVLNATLQVYPELQPALASAR